MMLIFQKQRLAASLVFALSCGGSEAQQPPPKAAAAQPQKAGAPQAVAAPKPVSASDRAGTRFAELSGGLDKLGAEDAIDPKWLESTMLEINKLDPNHPAPR